MPRATFVVELDIDEDDTYGTDITSDVIDATIFRGRDDFLDAAQVGKLSVTLDNHLGKYAPKSPQVVTENTVGLTTSIPIRLRTTAPTTITHFTGWISSIKVNANPKKQTVTLSAVDGMDSLRRAIIGQRLIKGEATDLIIHRLLDAAEGELSTNPSFDDDPTVALPAGYTNFGAANTLTTSVTPMEADRRLTTTSITNQNTGYKHPLDSSISLTAKVTAVAYLKAASGASEGKDGRLGLADDGDAVGNFTLFTATGTWQRVVVSRNFNGASGPRVYMVGTPTNSVIAMETGSVHIILTEDVISRNFDVGDISPPYYGAFRAPAISSIDEIRDNELGGLFHFDGGGTAIFERGSARDGATSQGTVDETFWKVNYNEDANERVSKVSLSYAQFDPGPYSDYIWELNLPTSRSIAANGTAVIWADFGFFADFIVRPQANKDYRLNSLADDTGTDMTGTAFGTFTWIPYGRGLRLQFRNGATATFITQLAVRGQSVRLSSDNPIVEYIPPNPPSQPSEFEHEYLLNDNKTDITTWAQTLGDYADSQREKLSVTMRPRTTALLQQMLSRKISDRVTLINDDKLFSTGINGDYHIESIRHKIKKAGFLHETTWTVTPV